MQDTDEDLSRLSRSPLRFPWDYVKSLIHACERIVKNNIPLTTHRLVNLNSGQHSGSYLFRIVLSEFLDEDAVLFPEARIDISFIFDKVAL